MDVHDFFPSSASRISAFANAQVHLYRHDVRLQDYFEALQLDTLASPRVKASDLGGRRRPYTWTVRAADKASGLGGRRKIKADVLLCPNPDLRRKAEGKFFLRTLSGLAHTGAKVLCLLAEGSPWWHEAHARLAASGRAQQVEFIDPTAPWNRAEAAMRPRVASLRAQSAFAQTVQLLEPHGLNPSREVEAGFNRLAFFAEAWERLAPHLEFEGVVARCHWLGLCSPVCRTGRERGKPVIAFQQGVIGHTLDAPVSVSRFVAFGQPSASLLAGMNRRFFEAVGLPEPQVDYVRGGCLFDPVTSLRDQFDQQTLLMVDIPLPPGDFYGIASQCQALLQLGEKLLTSGLPLRRLVIRPHPHWGSLDLESCQCLARKFPARCELSHPAWSVEDDLRRSSVVAGILSGVLTVASACGLPGVFLSTPQGYKTVDLDCFASQTFEPDAAFSAIGKLLTDRQAYAGAQSAALRNAREYYAGGGNLNPDAAFFERMLRVVPPSSRPQSGRGR